MKPRMWGVLALVLLTLAGIVAGTMVGDVIFGRGDQGGDPDVTAHEGQHDPNPEASAPEQPGAPDADPTDAVVDAPIDDTDTDGPALTAPGAGQDPEPGPDLTPETISEADFNRVLDAAIDECGLEGFSEMDRGCADDRCTVLLAIPTPDQGYPNADHLVLCPAWKDSWGTRADATSTRVTCDDGEALDLVLLNPSTRLLQRRGQEGEGVVDDLDTLRSRACAAWGQ